RGGFHRSRFRHQSLLPAGQGRRRFASRVSTPRMLVVLLSTYDLGRQPFGLASPAAWLAEAGFAVRPNDLAVEALDEASVRAAGLVAFHLPMHTATRLAARWISRVRALNPRAPIACYGLYARPNEAYLRSLGVEHVLGGEYEADLVAIARGESVSA